MNALLWTIQAIAALVFLMTGLMKLTLPRERLVQRMKWVEDASAPLVKAIGALEVLGAVGLVLPPLVSLPAVLTPLAALGLVLTMIGATLVHLRHKESDKLGLPLLLLVLLAVVAWGRFGPLHF